MAVLFVDPAFPPVSSSVGPGLPEASCWLRCAELWPRAALPPSPGDIVVEQGQVGDCWLLASLSALAASASAPRLLARLFPTADAVAGSVTVSLYAHGAWTDVTVDTLVPCDAECQPLFARGSAAVPT